MFKDRIDAGEQLAVALRAYAGQHPLVLAIPRGAVPIGAILARRLGGDLDLVLVRKLHAPGAPEFAIGAIDESGWVYLGPHAGSLASPDYVAEQEQLQRQELARRRDLYTPGQARIDAAGRTVIVTDDGLATGATMIAALHAVRQRGPEKLVCAVPVGSPDSVRLVGEHADEIVCLETPRGFGAVSLFYASFPQLEDDEVIELLRQARNHPRS